jgi:hypothetical protein
MNNIFTLNFIILAIRPLTLRWKFNPRAFYPLVFLLMGTLFILWIFQISSIIQKTYLLRDYEKEFNILSEQTKNLEVRFSQINALENIESLIGDLSYEKIEEIRYIQLAGSQVVSK